MSGGWVREVNGGRVRPWHTLRGRMLLAAVFVEALMLTLLVANSVRLLYGSLAEQAQLHANQVSPVLNAALVAPLAQRDYATLQAVLDESRSVGGVEYLAVQDSTGKLVAISGWPRERALPPPDDAFSLAEKDTGARFDVRAPIALAGQRLGSVQFGLDLGHIVAARKLLVTQGVAIAAVEVLLSTGLLTLIGFFLTRHLTALTRCSEEVARGNYAPHALAEGDDDIGRLGAAFNAMSRAIKERVDELTQALDTREKLAHDVEQERARLSALLAAMDIGILFAGSDRRIAYANPAFCRLFDIDPEVCGTLVGAGLDDVMATSRNASATAALAGVEEDEVREMGLEDGRIVSWHNVPVRSVGGAPIGKLWICIDVTEPRLASQQLLQAKEAAEAASRAKTEFLATISHELRTPMNGVLGNLALLADSDLASEEQRLAMVARQSAESLLRLLDDILDLSKLEARRFELEEADCALADVVETVLEVMRPRAFEKGLVLTSHMLPTVPDVVVTDPARLRQILFNLVGNAVKFTHAGHVAVRARRGRDIDDDHFLLEFEVEDTGIGIAADAVPMLFERFTQADSSITRRYGGTGLGLAICQELCRALGGAIEVDTAPGRGSVFRFSVATRVGDPEALLKNRSPLHHPDAVVPAGLRILAVDDNQINRDIVRGILERSGHKVTLAEDGSEAVRLAGAQEFDLILMDIQMPDMDGLTATRLVRRMKGPIRRVPVIALTAHASGSSRPECLDAGMNGFVPKPLRPGELFREMATVLGAPAAKPEGANPDGSAEPPVEVAPEELIDVEQVQVLVDALGADGWQETLGAFSDSAREHIRQIGESLAAGQEHHRVAHTLKGLSWNVGAKRLGDQALALERAGADDARALAAELDGILGETLGAFETV
ncbi:hybrid sensor histidine kinase/response regulator [Azospirillum canadense]|uniref:hybrid sensor histidine kinase/response regulator n=1 Tax=Azospirillum canadense TaxID=403962 RepID=UPI002226BE5C|nr:ATP-binding protein [Azospirillum canadense]MCW2243287.1 signal transduction histidine kinase/CheY-like chemotaxis protein/HAMP domain-containing protein [Azospirillum canadense]